MSAEGRWVGNCFEWACPRCSSVLQALQGPATDDDAYCGRCNKHALLVACGAPHLATTVLETRAELAAAELRERELRLKLGALEVELAHWKGTAA